MGTSGIVDGVIGTAGHIDHGKSALVRRLTGIDPDRLKEEKERGMTTDIGFANFLLPCGKRVGIIDVPGHDRFVKNMIIGATGVKAALFVVAGDDGVMPQTREHLRILELLGVRDGVVAVTKTDLVDDELIDLVKEDVADLVKGSFLEGKPVIPVSVLTDEGIGDLEKAIDAVASGINGRERSAHVFRLPVQRVFSAKGYGTVVTGVPLAGEVAQGDMLEVVDRGLKVKVRRITAYHEEIQAMHGAHSIGLNLTKVEAGQVQRGHTVACPGSLVPTSHFEVRFKCLAEVGIQLQKVTDIHFFQGTAQRIGNLVLLDRDSVEPGGDALAQIRLAEPVFVAAGDRYVVRRPSPPETLGGGMVLSTSGKKLGKRKWRGLALEERECRMDDPERFLELLIRLSGKTGLSREELQRETLLSPNRLESHLDELAVEGKIRALESKNRFMDVSNLERMRREFLNFLMRYFDEHPFMSCVDKRVIESNVPWGRRVLECIIEMLEREGAIGIESGRVRLIGDSQGVNPDAAPLMAEIEARIRGEGYRLTRLKDLESELGATPNLFREAMGRLVHSGTLVPVRENEFAHIKAVASARRLLVDYLKRNPGMRIGFSAFKTILGASCTQAEHFLKYFSAEEKLLVRIGNLFTLSPGIQNEGKVRNP